MIIRNQEDLTAAVRSELQRSKDPRFVEIMDAAVRHLHAFVRETRLTEAEFHQACGIIARLGQLTTASHNEVVLMSGSLGVSALVCLLNNVQPGHEETTANLMGPFWREGAPRTPQGGSIVRSPTPGVPLFVRGWVHDRDGQPVEGAEVHVWHPTADGYYENQDPTQADMNLRGVLTTDARGYFAFRTIKPSGYPIPIEGPVGDLLRAQGRHNMRPAHIHFLIHKPGFKAQFSQVYSSDDPNLETDVQFAVTEALVGQYVRHEDAAPEPDVVGPWYALEHHFVIDRGETRLPRPPIHGKASGERPVRAVLARRPD